MNSTPSPIPLIASMGYRFSRGEDPQALLAELVDFVATVGALTPTGVVGDPMACADFVVLLAKGGARVATDQPGCAFEKLIKAPVESRSIFVLDLAHRLAGRPGELPFHLLARDFPLKLWDTWLSDPATMAALRAVDAEGRTVSHYLWAPNNATAKDHQARSAAAGNPLEMARASQQWFSSSRSTWALQAQLQELGFGMEVPDHHGRTALDLCIERLETEDLRIFTGLEICSQIEAAISRRSLSDQTLLVSGSRAVPRL